MLLERGLGLVRRRRSLVGGDGPRRPASAADNASRVGQERLELERRSWLDASAVRSTGELGARQQQVLGLAAQPLGIMPAQEIPQTARTDLTKRSGRRHEAEGTSPCGCGRPGSGRSWRRASELRTRHGRRARHRPQLRVRAAVAHDGRDAPALDARRIALEDHDRTAGVPASGVDKPHGSGTEPASATIDALDALAQRRKVLDPHPKGAGRRCVSRRVGVCNVFGTGDHLQFGRRRRPDTERCRSSATRPPRSALSCAGVAVLLGATPQRPTAGEHGAIEADGYRGAAMPRSLRTGSPRRARAAAPSAKGLQRVYRRVATYSLDTLSRTGI